MVVQKHPPIPKIPQTMKIIEFGPRTVQIWIRDLSFAWFFVPDPSKYLPGPQIPYKKYFF